MDYTSVSTVYKASKDKDLDKDLLKNPLDVFNSIDLSNKIINISTDSNSNNDQMVCELLGDINSKKVSNIRNKLDY